MPVVAEETTGRLLAERAASILLQDIVHPPTLEALSSQVGLTSFQLSRLFGAVMGRTIPGLLRQQRMERAASLLLESKSSVGEIASTVGYHSMSAFCRGFEREMNMTPSEYRQNNRKVTEN
ncbi:AraC-like DNA-binding protein [Roseimicrobium gellanilyticum]|uniref:AraC-like DNA-binding protein n=1 Tax=Roseimicrobium gellanilyticum TaxID=748857 RepID=A0A366HTM3_9BACT|nr:AraC family transcriptional regulator [Roseimicrobium gellanilyticum]RBP46264.1 AraC-like DNA-binding protein [Roseimicrobium gellanilyticum]